MVRVERARVVLHERLRQGAEYLRRAEPGELVAERRDRGTEIGAAPDRGIRAIRRHDEVKPLKLFTIPDERTILRQDAGGLQLRAQQLQELQPPDRREADAVDDDRFAPVHHRNVGPGFHRRRNSFVGLRIVGAQEFERPFRKHHAEAERGVARILLGDADLPARQLALDEVGEVEPRWPGTGNEHFHSVNSSMIVSRSQRLPGSRSKRSCQCAATSAGGIGTGKGRNLKPPWRS